MNTQFADYRLTETGVDLRKVDLESTRIKTFSY
jgi:hypothetical protein